MMRTLDPAPLIAIASHEEVRPWIGLSDPHANLEAVLGPRVCDPNNFCFLTREHDGAYLLLKLAQGLYAAHSLAVPAARGKPMLRLMKWGFREIFTATDCVEVVTQLPDGNLPAQAWASLAGFKLTYRREKCFPLMGDIVGCQFASLDYQTWAINDRENIALGEQFHTQLQAFGVADHEEDKVHDALVGATIASIQRQNVVKGVTLYNRYAALAGYQQAAIVSTFPPVVNTGDAVIGLADGALQVLQARRVNPPS